MKDGSSPGECVTSVRPGSAGEVLKGSDGLQQQWKTQTSEPSSVAPAEASSLCSAKHLEEAHQSPPEPPPVGSGWSVLTPVTLQRTFFRPLYVNVLLLLMIHSS